MAGTGHLAAQERRVDPREVLKTIARLYELDPELLKAIARVESNYNPVAISPAGAQGLMQLMPHTARRYGVADPFDPVQSAIGGARFLNDLKQWQAQRPGLELHLPELLAAYNAGPQAVEKYGGIPPYPETHRYIRQVLASYLLGEAAAGENWWAPAGRRTMRPRRPARTRPALQRTNPDLNLLKQLCAIRNERDGRGVISLTATRPAPVR